MKPAELVNIIPLHKFTNKVSYFVPFFHSFELILQVAIENRRSNLHVS